MAARNRRRMSFGQLLALVILIAIAVLILIPLVFTFLYSFFPPTEIKDYLKGAAETRYDNTKWLEVLFAPAMFSVRQYYTILIEVPRYLQLFVNSTMYTAAILFGQALVIPLMAFGLSRFTFRGRDALFFLILMLMLLPFQVTMAPSVYVLNFLKLMDTPWAIILPMCFSPFYIFLLRQYMVTLPNELLEAGMMDGAGPFRSFVHVVVPVCRPILGAAAALSFADCWNLVEQPLTFLAKAPNLQPLSVMFNQLSQEGSDVAFAGAALYILPALLVYFYFQEDILLGIQLSELK